MTWEGPDLALPDCGGEERGLSDLVRERGLVLALGAAWCAPCQEDAPALQVFSEQNPDVGVVQVLVQDADGAPATSLACAEWTAAFALTHAVLIDPVFRTEDIMDDQGFPVHVAYDAGGEERYWQAGPFDPASVATALSEGGA